MLLDDLEALDISVLDLDEEQKEQIFITSNENLKASATDLKDAQTELSLKTSSLSQESLEDINPENVNLNYKKTEGMPDSYNYTIWQAIMEIVVSAYRITTMSRDEISIEDPTVYFVTTNSLNSVLIALEMSTNAIMVSIQFISNSQDETEASRKYNIQIFLYLLITASGSLLLSLMFLLPIINKVKKNKQDVLELFMSVKKKDIEEELTKCRKYLAQFQVNSIKINVFQSNSETEMAAGEDGELDKEGQNEDGDELNKEMNDINAFKKNIIKKFGSGFVIHNHNQLCRIKKYEEV